MSGIGNISNAGGVGYTDMNGLGLNDTTQDGAQVDAAVSSSMSTDITNALAQFRAEGNFNPTAAEMEAKLSAVGVAAQQDDINQVQHLLTGMQMIQQDTLNREQTDYDTVQGLLTGFQKMLQDAETSNQKGAGDKTVWTWAVTNVVAAPTDATRAQYFGTDASNIENLNGAFAALYKYLPNWNQNFASEVSGGNVDAENSGWTNAQISDVINQLTAKLASLPNPSAGTSNTTDLNWQLQNIVGSTDQSTIAKYFGTALDGQWTVMGALNAALPGVWNTVGQTASEKTGLTSAQTSQIITLLQNKLSSLKSQTPSSVQDFTGAQQMTAAQWLSKEAGVQSPSDSLSLEQWGNIAQKLQTNAAQKLSELSMGNGGGIQELNGQYFVNGQELSLSQINFCVRANQYQLIDQQVADQMNAIQENNKKAQETQQVLAAIQSYDGENVALNTDGSCSADELLGGQGGSSWGALQHYLNTNFGVTATSVPNYADYENVIAHGTTPNNYTQTGNTLSLATLATMGQNVQQFFSILSAADNTFYKAHVTDTNGGPPYAFSGTISNSEYNDLKTSFGTYLQNNSSDNQVAQQKLDALNNSRQAILDGMSAFTQGQAQSTGQIGTNL
jgi:hypothetical protein